MNKLFPDMFDRPDTHRVVAGIGFCLFPFFLVPFLLRILVVDTPKEYEVIAWLDIVYHVFNAVAMLVIFGAYLKESFFNVRYNVKNFFATVGIAAGAMILAGYVVGRMIGFTEKAWLAYSIFPLTEVELMTLSGDILYFHPWVGLACMVLLTPLTISGMYYATAFSPLATNRPWLAYIIVAVYLLVPRLLYSFSFWYLEEELMLYLVQLPVHLIACWSYQKADTIWAPICSLTLVNLFTGLGMILFFMIY